MTDAELDALVARLLSETVIHDDSDKTVMLDMGNGPVEVAAGGKITMCRNPDGPEAAAALTTLRKQRDELREAVEPALDYLEILHSITQAKDTRAAVWKRIKAIRQALSNMEEPRHDT